MNQCPCGSGRALAECCQPLLDGDQSAKTAEELLRARYTSHFLKKADYLINTTHPDKRTPEDEAAYQNFFKAADWTQLEIIDIQKGGVDDDQGQIEFIAHYTDKDGPNRYHELSTFIKHDGQWFFDDSKAIKVKPYIRDKPKIGRNQPCPCGSGKKYKKCCGR